MGRAQIIDGGADGRYTIQVDYGSAQRQALIDAFNSLIANIDVKIAALEVDIAAQQAAAEEGGATLKAQVDAYITSLQAGGGTGGGNLTSNAGTTLQDFLRRQLIILSAAKQRNQLRLDALRFERAEAVQKIAALNSAQPLVTKQAWCTTLTEDATGTVATIDINGESNLTLIAPEGRTWQAADGVMTMPHVMSPEQSFLNTAILPGWQRHKPKYRWGTIGNIDVDANTCDVSLAAATSSAQNLPINRFTNLTGIPVEYLSCNAQAFTDGDRVVVQFTETLPGQFDAKVIGFLDNPKPCGWPAVYANSPALGFGGVWFKPKAAAAFDALWEALKNNEAVISVRTNWAPAWSVLPFVSSGSPTTDETQYRWYYRTSSPGGAYNFRGVRVVRFDTSVSQPTVLPNLNGCLGFNISNESLDTIGDRTYFAVTGEVLITKGAQVLFNAAIAYNEFFFDAPTSGPPTAARQNPQPYYVKGGGFGPILAGPPDYPSLPMQPLEYTLRAP